jgi:hypothetical protein
MLRFPLISQPSTQTSIQKTFAWSFTARSRRASRLAALLLLMLLAAVLLTAVAVVFAAPVSLPSGHAANQSAAQQGVRPASQPTSQSTCVGKHESPVQLVFFYKPVVNITESWLNQNFDFFIYTKRDEESLTFLKQADERGTVSPTAPTALQYIKYDAVQDPCFQAKNPAGTPCACDRNPLNNQVGWERDDICWIRDNHPEWFLRGADGELLYFQYHIMMDPGQAGWRDYWIARLREYHAQYPWDGIFIDNLATRFGLHNADFVPLQDYPNDQVYQDTVVDFFQDVRERYFDPEAKSIYANISVYQDDLPVYLRYLEYMEGAMDEFWAYGREEYYSVRGWVSRLERMSETLALGKRAFLISQGTWEDHERMRFGLASYLLIADENAYFRYTRQESYERAWLYDEYRLPLGEPLGAFTTDGVTWTRQFANGNVSVTPGTQDSTITLHNPEGDCAS